MKIDRVGDNLIIDISDTEDRERSKFFYALSGVPFSGWLNSNTVVYDTALFTEQTTAIHLRRIRNSAINRGVHITSPAEELFEKFSKRLEEIEYYRRLDQEKQRAEREAACTVKIGCCLCDSLKWIKGKPFCEYVGKYCALDSNEVEDLYEEWKETKKYKRPTPFPVKGCKVIEEARRISNGE